MIMKCIFNVRSLVRAAVQSTEVGVVLREKKFRLYGLSFGICLKLACWTDWWWGRKTIKVSLAELLVFYIDTIDVVTNRGGKGGDRWFFNRPRPSVGEPELRNNMKSSWIWPSVVTRDTNVHIFRIVFIFRVL